MRILLTGSTGQIGCELSQLLSDLGELRCPTTQVLDQRDPASIRAVVRDERPDLIVNAAGFTAVDRAESDPETADQLNHRGPAILAEETRRLGAALVHFSTDYVFDGGKAGPYAPDDEPNPINVYGRSKLDGERAIQASGASHIILRTSWVYSLRRSNFLLTMLRLAAVEPELRVVNDQWGCPSWSRSMARATVQIIRSARSRAGDGRGFGEDEGVYHIASGGMTTWFGLANEIFNLARITPSPRVIPITTDDYPTAATRPRNSVLDCGATEVRFGIQLPVWNDALAEALSEHETRSEGVPARREEER